MERLLKRVKKTETDHRRLSLAGARNSNYGSGQEWRDWTELPDDVVLTIAETLLSEDVTYYIRLRAICASWRKCTRDPKADPTEMLFRPVNWIPIKCDRLIKPKRLPLNDELCYLNLTNGKYLRVKIPELISGIFRVIFMVQGHLLLWNQITGGICLLNPFTRSVAELPPLKSLRKQVTKKRTLCFKKYLSNVIFLPSSEVVLFFSELSRVVYAKPGEQQWVAFKTDLACFSVLYFKGRLYAVTRAGYFLQLNLNSKTEIKHLVTQYWRRDKHYLVEFEGQMLLLYHYIDPWNRQPNHFEVHKVDVERMRLARTTLPIGCALILSDAISSGRSLSVSTSVFPCMEPDHIYVDGMQYGKLRRNLINVYATKSKEYPWIRLPPLQSDKNESLQMLCRRAVPCR